MCGCERYNKYKLEERKKKRERPHALTHSSQACSHPGLTARPPAARPRTRTAHPAAPSGTHPRKTARASRPWSRLKSRRTRGVPAPASRRSGPARAFATAATRAIQSQQFRATISFCVTAQEVLQHLQQAPPQHAQHDAASRLRSHEHSKDCEHRMNRAPTKITRAAPAACRPPAPDSRRRALVGAR